MKNHQNGSINNTAILIYLLMFVYTFSAWLTHVIVCIKAGSWGFLIAGAIFAPIGVIHGTGVWFGAW